MRRMNSNRQTYEKLELSVSTFRMRGKRFPNRYKIAPFLERAILRPPWRAGYKRKAAFGEYYKMR